MFYRKMDRFQFVRRPPRVTDINGLMSSGKLASGYSHLTHGCVWMCPAWTSAPRHTRILHVQLALINNNGCLPVLRTVSMR